MEAFGDKLRKQREHRGITLEAISSTTKISTRMLRALEEEKFEQLPGGVFNKGFVRAYARQVGLDEEEAVADYLAALRESQIQSQPILPDFRSGKPLNTAPKALHHPPYESPEEDRHHDARPLIAADDNSTSADRRLGSERRNEDRRVEERRTRNENQKGEPWQIENRPASDLLRSAHGEQSHETSHQPPTPTFTTGSFGESGSGNNYLRWGTLAAAFLILTAGLAFWNVHRRNRSLHLEPIATASPVTTPSQAPSPLESSASKSSPSIHPLKARLESPSAVTAEKTSAAATRPAGAQNPSAPPSISHAAVSQHVTSDAIAGSAAIVASSKVVSQPTAGTTAAPFTLLIRAEKNSWVSITADGKLVAEETLIAPAEKSVRASNDIVVKAGNAAGVSFLLNSKEIPAEGQDGQVKTYTFDASGMKVSPSSRPPGTD